MKGAQELAHTTATDLMLQGLPTFSQHVRVVSEQPMRKRGYQDNSEDETPTKSQIGSDPHSTVNDKKRHRSSDARPQQPGFEIHFCAQNKRGAFQKWYQGRLKLLDVDSFFEHFYKSCGLKGHLTSITFTWNDMVPKRAWEVEAGDAKEFEAFKDKTRQILAEGKYVGIFHIDMEPTLEVDEHDEPNTIVVDI